MARGTFSLVALEKVIAAQTRRRDRLALRLLFYLGLRKGELARVQFKHFDTPRRRLVVFGKAGKVRHVPIVDESLWRDLETLILDEQPAGDEFLLYPERHGPLNQHRTTQGAPYGLLWEDRSKPMSGSTLQRWWAARLKCADVPYQPMHEARHTAITELLRTPGSHLKHAQLLAGHASIQTTADIYAHLDDNDLERVLRDMSVERDRRRSE